jgi:hypothetical protein
MSNAAQDPNTDVNDIWSLPDTPAQPLKVNIPSGGGESERNWESGNINAEVYRSPEIPESPEIGEKPELPEVHKPTHKKERVILPQEDQPGEASPKGKVVDQRTGKEKMHRVAEAADNTTKVADIKEQEFIEGVESVHSII